LTDTAMSDQPERIIAKRYPNGVVGARDNLTPKEGYSEYIRKDIADAAVQAERERCAKVAAAHLERVQPHSPDDDMLDKLAQAIAALAYGTAALNIATAIRKGDQP
jgi:hypothetical protein